MAHTKVPLPPEEALRIEALEHLQILDTLPETSFDDIVELATTLCGTPIALVSLVDSERQWFKACVGLDVRQTPRDQAFCAHAILVPEALLMVEDATLDPRFNANPLVLGAPFIRFYAGAPVLAANGQALGTVCVIDTVPRSLTASQANGLQALARQASALLQLRTLSLAREQQARDLSRKVIEALGDNEQAHSALRHNQRVAAVGQLTSGIIHDFNNLLQTLTATLQLLQLRAERPGEVGKLTGIGLQAVAHGAKLIAQLLAYSRKGGVELEPVSVCERIEANREVLKRVLGSSISLHFDLAWAPCQVLCDGTQLEAALLNMLVNSRDAIDGAGRIHIATRLSDVAGDAQLADGRYLVLSVTDSGAGMSATVLAQVFEPFFTTKAAGKGTGLGLSQVYGFALKADGTARVRSEPGNGTEVALWLRTLPLAPEGSTRQA
ncbi:MAG: ATP-binding protein [Pseudomonas sp.]|uniref:ATP-binding protein n=1 Tax=Pseudomonas abieticivorans TaxID=2931382 RepID=UPI0020C0E376|nr:ATP-binding protein [Pseudomonas sp. PIA16]MDE1163860.1 ATP-binding protein [Pseudomonas sp.]